MLSNSIKHLKHFIAETRIPPKSILITYCSPLVLYTFLNIRTAVFSKDLDRTVDTLSCKELTLFLSAIRNQTSLLKNIQQINYPYLDLQLLHKNQPATTNFINSNKQTIKQTAELFGSLTSAILKQADERNFVDWMEICLKLQIIDIRVWNHFIKLGQQNFNFLTETNLLRILKALHTYLESFFMKNTFAPNKFIYRENVISDIYSLQGLSTRFFKQIVRRIQSSLNFQLQQSFKILVMLMMKINRGLTLNLYELQKHYKASHLQFNNLVQKGNINTVFSILKYISFLGLYDQTILQNIENKILTHIQNKSHQITFSQKYTFTTVILQVWNAFNYNNPAIFQTLMRPVLTQLLKVNDEKTPITTSIIFNMICSNLEEEQLIQKLMNKVSQKYPIQSKAAHIISHYMGIRNKTKSLTSYPHCFQNKVGLEIAQRNKVVYSNCMERSLEDYPEKQKYKPHHASFEKYYGKEANPPEQIWLSILQSVFQDLTKKYPHPDNKLVLNFSFCVFEIDALIVLNQQYIAFQYEGLHYKIQNMNEDKGLVSKGNKLIKKRILQAYGLKILQIDSSNPVVRNISAFKHSKGAEYLQKVIQQMVNS